MPFTVDDLNDTEQLRRKLILTPCATKEGLKRWLKMYFGFDPPDTKIDDSSTGSVLDTFWEIYQAGVTNDLSAPSRYMWYASRDSFKTLSASMLEVLAMLHAKRSVIHLSAILQQSLKAAEYYRDFLNMDGISEFKIGDNKRTAAVLWFEHIPTGNILTLKEWKALGGRSQIGNYKRHSYYIKIIVNTAKSANSDHTSWLCVDEIELIQFPKAYKEALFIPTTTKNSDGQDQPPITLLTSSRKYSGGLVQEEIDAASETGTAVRHHNILDVTSKCPTERHRPDLPKIDAYYSKETLKVVLKPEYDELCKSDPKKAATFIKDNIYHGCYHNCKIYPGCLGRLSYKQTCESNALKPVFDTIRKWKEVGDIEMVKAQLLCWKPGNEGSIYSNFSRQSNMLTLDKMWLRITGNERGAPVTKADLLLMCAERGYPFVAGMDFGYSHCFAVTIGAVVGRNIYIFDAFEIPGLEPHQCVEECDRRIKHFNPLIWPDTAYPAYIKMFRSAGYRMREHNKDVIGGIESVRKKIAPANSMPELYLIDGDEGCDLLAKRCAAYRWKEDSIGRITDVPDDKDDDLMDALRYMIQNTFDRSSGIILSRGVSSNLHEILTKEAKYPTPSEQMIEKIKELTNGESNRTIGFPAYVQLKAGTNIAYMPVRKKGIITDFS